MISLLSRIVPFNNLSVIGIFRTDEGDMYHTLNIKKKGSKLTITASGAYATFDELKKNTDPKVPALLVIDGKGILNKKINSSNETDVNWQKNLDFSTIHYTELKAADNVFISFCRKKLADELLADFQKNGFLVLDLFIGPVLAVLLHGTVPEGNLLSNDSYLEFENNVLSEISKNKETRKKSYTIGDKSLSQSHLPLYGAAIYFFVKPKEITKSSSDTINREEILYRKAFNYFGAAMLAFIFTALLASYFLIQYYSSENMELNQKNVYSSQTYQHIVELEKQKDQKLKILNETGQLSKNFLTFYAYELSKSVHSAIRMNELAVFPLLKEVKANEKVALTAKIIRLRGSTASEASFNAWLEDLKKMQWIQKFEILSFKKDKKNILQFEIKILLNDF